MIDNPIRGAAGGRYTEGAARRDLPSRHAADPTRLRPGPPSGYQQIPVPPAGNGLLCEEPTEAYHTTRPPGGRRFTVPPEPTVLERALPSLRRQVGHILGNINLQHATTAWERRRRDPIGPHVLLVFHYDPPAGDPPQCRPRTGCRTFFAADEPRLPHLLHQIREVTIDHIRAGRDLRTNLLNWCEPMSRHAAYLGVAVCSLDAADRSWPDLCREARSDMDIPGRGWAILLDGTHLFMERRSVKELGDVTITTNRPCGDTSHLMRRRWSYQPDFTNPDHLDPASLDIWTGLNELHDVLFDALFGATT